ncbi:DNA alkylation repair protein [Rosettibacter firmus]|uniref:DNA alkylation repair protein n=1 Tax=Rosettibacter firmus TaxID=3111522 RepID=UPI00336C2487
MTVEEIIKELKKHKNKNNLAGMARFGINVEKAFGISIPFLRALAKKIGKNHNLALQLWETKYHEARILASMIDEPELVSKLQMDKWAKEFNSWDLCDQVCMNLFSKSPFAKEKIFKWSNSKKEFVKRAAFTLIACLAHDKNMNNKEFIKFFTLIKKQALDERNYVKKAVNWALRQIGKRNEYLKNKALQLSEEILKMDSSAKWIARDAIRELKKII